MNWQDVPVYITNWNNLETGFRTTVDWFLDLGMIVTVFDNKSSYPPLLEYYSKNVNSRLNIVNVGYNSGVWGFWQGKFNTEERTKTHYITTDSDCPPDDICPKDLVEKMVSVLDAYPDIRKVSPGLRIDNLPDWYARKSDAIGCQRGLPSRQAEDKGLGNLFHTYTDSTMTMWRGGYRAPGRCSIADDNGAESIDIGLRMEAPYVLKHVPWYANSLSPTAESLFYRSRTDHAGGCVFGM